MRYLSMGVIFFVAISLLPSCEFHCNVGTAGEDGKHKPVIDKGIKLYNGIHLETNKVAVNKAYLLFANGDRVPPDNFIGEDSPVKLIVLIDSGWVVENETCRLGASEKITAENGELLLDEKDLFQKKETQDLSAKDAKIIGITASIRLIRNTPPQTFNVSFRIWDKRGDGFIEGNYQLVSK